MVRERETVGRGMGRTESGGWSGGSAAAAVAAGGFSSRRSRGTMFPRRTRGCGSLFILERA